MKCFYVLCFALIAAVYSKELYSTENDNLDIEKVVGDIETLKAFIGCFLDTAPCDAVTGDFKKDIPEAVVEACAKCTVDQKHLFKRFLEEVQVKLPQEFQAFKNKFDPKAIHFEALQAAVASS